MSLVGVEKEATTARRVGTLEPDSQLNEIEMSPVILDETTLVSVLFGFDLGL